MKLLGPLVFILANAVVGSAVGAEQCSASAVSSPDGTSLTILFDDLSAAADGQPTRTCAVSAPLNLPEGYSLGVYRVDYRGFAHLAKKETATLVVDYNLGPRANGRQFKRTVRGAIDDDFSFTENIGAGQMKRVGCGSTAVLSVDVGLSLDAGAGESLVALDTSDGTTKHGLVYHLNLKKCAS
jgi:hypothetical protein